MSYNIYGINMHYSNNFWQFRLISQDYKTNEVLIPILGDCAIQEQEFILITKKAGQFYDMYNKKRQIVKIFEIKILFLISTFNGFQSKLIGINHPRIWSC